MANNQDGGIYPIGVIAKLFNMTERNVRYLTEQGVITKEARGKYALAPTVQRYIKYLQDKALSKDLKPSDVDSELALEKLLHERAKRRRAEYSANEIERNMHSSSDVEFVWGSIVTNTKQKLLSMPDRIAPHLQTVEDLNEIKNIILTDIEYALVDLADYNIEAFYKNSADEDDSDANDTE